MECTDVNMEHMTVEHMTTEATQYGLEPSSTIIQATENSTGSTK